MIKFEARYFNNAHRISDYTLDPTVTTLYDGQWLMMSADKTMTISDGTVKSYITLSSKFGNPSNNIGLPIATLDDPTLIGSDWNAFRNGRDTVTPAAGKVTVLAGPFRLETDQYKTDETYTLGMPLKVSSTGILVPFVVGTDTRHDLIVANVSKVPVDADDTIGFIAN